MAIRSVVPAGSTDDGMWRLGNPGVVVDTTRIRPPCGPDTRQNLEKTTVHTFQSLQNSVYLLLYPWVCCNHTPSLLRLTCIVYASLAHDLFSLSRPLAAFNIGAHSFRAGGLGMAFTACVRETIEGNGKHRDDALN